jgi:hypothetical protein
MSSFQFVDAVIGRQHIAHAHPVDRQHARVRGGSRCTVLWSGTVPECANCDDDNAPRLNLFRCPGDGHIANMRIAIRGAPALLVLVLSSLGCAAAPAPHHARAPREPPQESPLRGMLGPRPVVWVASPQERPTSHTAAAPDVHLARRVRR